MAKRNRKPEDREQEATPIVAIGASAGGIDALRDFLAAVPEESGLAFVVVLHLSPEHESHLVAVLQRMTPLEVLAVEREAALRPDCVYVIQPNSVLTIADDRLRARKPKTSFERRHPVDAIFQSLARQRGAGAMCAILSGSGANGSAGAQTVRERDGLVLAQSPETAAHPEMPRNAIQGGWADRVLPPGAMPAVLASYASGTLPRLDGSEEKLAEQAEAELNGILAVLRTRGHHDFAPYKKKTLVRRILRRMGLAQLDSLRHYADRLRDDPEEVQTLVNDLLINVTGFFRDPEAWQALEEEVVAPLIASRQDGQSVRVWVPACSTGEEAYSIAMLLLEHAEAADKQLDLKVFATDAAPQSLARARAGLFPAALAEAIPAERRARFFEQEDDLFRARKLLRETVVFAPQNLLADPPFSRLDLVTCRNLLIYLEPQIQDRVIALLHFALREDGCLFLGTAETVGRHADLFQPVSKKWRIYRRIGGTRHELVDFPLLGAEHHPPRGRSGGVAGRRSAAEEAREALVGSFAPPAVLVDERQRVLYFNGDLDPFLKTPAGEPTLDLMALAREELRAKLRAAIRQATKERVRITAEVRLGEPGELVRISVAPLAGTGARLLVSFEALGASEGVAPARPGAREKALSDGELEEELRSTREELRLSIEQLESSNEELKASNEEITSMNEELQSTNEELETSKEELQSLNEELNTVNTQLQGKVEELEDRTNDLNNLLNSTDIATLFLDEKFRIRWFTPPVRSLFQVIPSDVGRPITDFARRFLDEAFLDDAREVLRSLQTREKEVRGEGGSWHLRRLLPYRTDDNRIDGIVATFTDITERKRWEEALAAAKAYAESIVETTRQPLVVLTEELRVRSANRAFYDCFGLSPERSEGRLLFDLGDGDWDIPALRRALAGTTPQSAVLTGLAVTHDFRALGRRHLVVDARRLDDAALTLLAIEDATERKEAEQAREVLLAELHHRVKNLLTKVQAIVRLSRGTAKPVAEYADDLLDRINAIARTEELIGGRTGDIPLRELVEAELSSVAVRGAPRVEGPDVRLSPRIAQVLALALHELSTNAVKYGAFCTDGGELEVSWSLAERKGRRLVTLEWHESGVRIDGEPGESFGSKLIKVLVPQMLGGSSRWEPTDGGVSCVIELPLPPEDAESAAAR